MVKVCIFSLYLFLKYQARPKLPFQHCGLWRVGSAMAHGAMGPGRADEAGPSLSRDVEEASAGDGRSQSSVPTFLKRMKHYIALLRASSLAGEVGIWEVELASLYCPSATTLHPATQFQVLQNRSSSIPYIPNLNKQLASHV